MRVVAFLALLAIAFGCMGFLIRAMHRARAFNPPDIVNKFADDDLDPVVTESLRRREMEMLSADSFDDVVPASIKPSLGSASNERKQSSVNATGTPHEKTPQLLEQSGA